MPTTADVADNNALSLLIETIESLASARTVEQVAAVIRSSARAISGADGVSFVVRAGNECWYVDEDAIGPLWKGRKFPLDACVSGWTMLNGKTAIIPDIHDDPRAPQDAYRATFVKSMVMTPVRPADPMAAIGAYWAEKRQPTAEEVMKLELIARATATALENASLYASLTDALANRDGLIAELDHRVKNILASVMSMASQTLRGAPTPDAFKASFNGRLMTLSRAHDLLARRGWRDAPVALIVEEALRPFVQASEGGLSAGGPDIRLSTEAASALLLSLYELGDNACRYGAWSRPGGHVDLGWSADSTVRPPLFRLSWRERGGPPVVEPERRGFGARLIEHGLARPPAGHARITFDRQGLAFEMSAPFSDRVRLVGA